jgi:hypothetical protein
LLRRSVIEYTVAGKQLKQFFAKSSSPESKNRECQVLKAASFSFELFCFIPIQVTKPIFQNIEGIESIESIESIEIINSIENIEGCIVYL